jgi:hypothetical protein
MNNIVAYYEYTKTGKIILGLGSAIKPLTNPGAMYSKSRHMIYQTSDKTFTIAQVKEIEKFLEPILAIKIKPMHEHIRHLRNLLTYDDLDEEEKINAAVEYIDDIIF